MFAGIIDDKCTATFSNKQQSYRYPLPQTRAIYYNLLQFFLLRLPEKLSYWGKCHTYFHVVSRNINLLLVLPTGEIEEQSY